MVSGAGGSRKSKWTKSSMPSFLRVSTSRTMLDPRPEFCTDRPSHDHTQIGPQDLGVGLLGKLGGESLRRGLHQRGQNRSMWCSILAGLLCVETSIGSQWFSQRHHQLPETFLPSRDEPKFWEEPSRAAC